MILLHVLADTKEHIQEIADLLLLDHLVVDATLAPVENRTLTLDNQPVTVKKWLLIGKTKSILFDQIDAELRKTYPNRLPTIYSTPIVHMDWEQAAHLKDVTRDK